MMRFRHRRLPLYLVVFLLPALASVVWAADGAKIDPPPCAFVHANVVPLNENRVIADQTVVVRNGVIAEIGPSKTVMIPRRACKIEAKGKFLIPGLVDAHVHLHSPNELPLYLANGVTTVFNLDGHPAHLLWRQQIARGEMTGPTIFTTGPIFQRTRTAEEDVRLVDQQADAGYDGVKIYNQVSKAEYPALIAEAKKRNLLLMGHVARGPDFEMTLQSGQSIAHLEEFTYTFFNPKRDDQNEHIVYDESKIPEAVRLTKEAGVSVTATLSTYATIVQQATDLDTFLKNPELKYLAPWMLAEYQPALNGYKNYFSAEYYPQLRASLAFQRKLLKALSDGGVPLMCGTDAPGVGPLPGFGVHEELQEFVNDGLTPYQALRTATVNVARYLRHENEFGTVETGKRADLVLLEGNPLLAIANTRRIAGVMVRGEWIPKAELERMMDDVPLSYRRDVETVKIELQSNPAGASEFLRDRDPYFELANAVFDEIEASEGIGKTRSLVHSIRKKDKDSQLVSEASIDRIGNALLEDKKYSEAVAFLEMNTEDFPGSANAFDRLAAAQIRSGDLPHALENYRKALAVDPNYPNAREAGKILKENSQQ